MMMPGHPGQLQPVHPMHGGPPLQNVQPPAQNTQQQSSNRQSASLVNLHKYLRFFSNVCFVYILETKLYAEVHISWSHEGRLSG